MYEWVVYSDGQKRLSENYDYCEKCERLFYGVKCNVCGSKNTRIGMEVDGEPVIEEEEDK